MHENSCGQTTHVKVVAAVPPWNFPQLTAMAEIAPALAAGCTVVVKPSPETTPDAYVSAEAAGLPPGALNMAPAGLTVGVALGAHPGVNQVSSTSSTAGGCQIGELCGRLIRATLEVGGKSASIVLEDADLDLFAANLPATSFINHGQACILQSRTLAPRSRYDAVIEAMAESSRTLIVGNPVHAAVTCGPMVASAHRDRVLGYIDAARDSSARLVTAGGRPQALPRRMVGRTDSFRGCRKIQPIGSGRSIRACRGDNSLRERGTSCGIRERHPVRAGRVRTYRRRSTWSRPAPEDPHGHLLRELLPDESGRAVRWLQNERFRPRRVRGFR